MKLLNRLPGSVREPAGLEWTILKKLPLALLAGTLAPMAFSLAKRVFPPEGPALEVARHIQFADIIAIATVITVWTAVFTAAILCAVVVVMKGPGYVADAYELSDADHPRPRGRSKSGLTSPPRVIP